MSAGAVLEAAEPTWFHGDALYEIVDGKHVETPPMSSLAGKLANRLAHQLNACAWPNEGEAFVEMLFHLALPVDRNRRPDVAWVSFQRWAKDREMPPENAWDVVPNLSAEIVSPTDLVEETMDKIAEYFRSGVQLVWVIFPTQKRVYVYESPTLVRVLTQDDVLDGGKVLPQFHLPLKEFFIG
jgi:Uma2 family endonuclease